MVSWDTKPEEALTLIESWGLTVDERAGRKLAHCLILRGKSGQVCWREALLRNTGFEFYAAIFYADRVFHFLASLALQFFRLFAYEALEIFQTRRAGFFPGFRPSFDQPLIKLLYLFVLALRIGKRRGKRFRCFSLRHRYSTPLGRNSRRIGCHLARSFRLNCFCCCAEMALLPACFLLHGFLAPHVHVFCIRLRQIVVAKSLRETQLASALVVPPQKRFHSPLGVRRRTRTSTAEELLVLNLQRANVAFNLI